MMNNDASLIEKDSYEETNYSNGKETQCICIYGNLYLSFRRVAYSCQYSHIHAVKIQVLAAADTGQSLPPLRQETADAAREALFDDVYFDVNQHHLLSERRKVLKNLARWLAEHHNHFVVLRGHVDERCSSEYNLELGKRLASR